jgi:hypothetical protein
MRSLALLAVVVLAGCDGHCPVGETDELAAGEYQSALWQVECEHAVDCYGSGESVGECVASMASSHFYTPADVQDSVDEGRIAYDADAAAACLAALCGLGCEDLAALDGYPAACAEALAGTVGAGEACEIDADCRNNLFECIGGECADPEPPGT